MTSWSDINYAGDSRNANLYTNAFPTNTAEELAAGLGDPCAYYRSKHGGSWKMPTASTYEQVPSSTDWYGGMPSNGHRYNSSTYFPAAGGRAAASGALDLVDQNGYYWSSYTSNKSTGSGLYFNQTSAKSYYWDRKMGTPIRCLK